MSNVIPIETASNGTIQYEGIHDALIIETSITGEGSNISAVVRCRSEGGELFSFHIDGVKIFNLSAFVSQNIINSCVLLSKTDVSHHLPDVEHAEAYLRPTHSTLKALILDGSLILLRFHGSVGADIDCICRSVKMMSDK